MFLDSGLFLESGVRIFFKQTVYLSDEPYSLSSIKGIIIAMISSGSFTCCSSFPLTVRAFITAKVKLETGIDRQPSRSELRTGEILWEMIKRLDTDGL